jgi:hypothetical protein
VLGLQVAHDESAAVQPDDGALRMVRAIDPDRHVRIGGHGAVLDLHACGVGCGCSGGERGEVLARGDRVGQVGGGEQREEWFQFGIDRHLHFAIPEIVGVRDCHLLFLSS